MLGTHSIAQPYKLKAHNVIDSLLLLDLATINVLKIAILKVSRTGLHLLPYIIYTQLLFIYIPIIVLVIFCVIRLIRTAHKHLGKKVEDKSEQEIMYLMNNRSMVDSMKTSDVYALTL